MRSNQPIADILLWDCDNHLEKEGGKRLFRMGQGETQKFSQCYRKILLYGSETWTLTKQMTLRLDGCYTNFLRYI